MSFFVCIYDMTVYKRALNLFCIKTERNNFFIARLFIEFGEVYSLS